GIIDPVAAHAAPGIRAAGVGDRCSDTPTQGAGADAKSKPSKSRKREDELDLRWRQGLLRICRFRQAGPLENRKIEDDYRQGPQRWSCVLSHLWLLFFVGFPSVSIRQLLRSGGEPGPP